MANLETLMLPGVKLLSQVEDPQGMNLRVRLQQLPELTPCPVCGGETQGHGWTPKKGVVDSRSMNRRVKLDIEQQRVKCKKETCQKAVVRGLPFLHKQFKMTQRLFAELQIIFKDLGRRFDNVAAEVGMSERTARSVFEVIAAERERLKSNRACLGDVVWIARVTVHQESRFLVINVDQKTLVEMTGTIEEGELLALLTRLGKAQKPMWVWIPVRSDVRRVVRQAFKNCRIALAQDGIDQILAKANKDIKKIDDLEAREAAQSAVLSVLRPIEQHSGPVGDAPRERLRRVAQKEVNKPPLTWLAVWLVDWEEELLTSQSLARGTSVPLTVQQAKRGISLLNTMGNGYSFAVLRQRLLYALDQVWAYDPPQALEGRMHLQVWMGDPDRLTWYGDGLRVGTFGVSLEKITAALERAALESPQTLPEGESDDN